MSYTFEDILQYGKKKESYSNNKKSSGSYTFDDILNYGSRKESSSNSQKTSNSYSFDDILNYGRENEYEEESNEPVFYNADGTVKESKPLYASDMSLRDNNYFNMVEHFGIEEAEKYAAQKKESLAKEAAENKNKEASPDNIYYNILENLGIEEAEKYATKKKADTIQAAYDRAAETKTLLENYNNTLSELKSREDYDNPIISERAKADYERDDWLRQNSLEQSYGQAIEDEYRNALTKDEQKAYNYLYATQGKDAAEKLYNETILPIVKRRLSEEKKEANEKFAQEHPGLSSLLTIPVGLVSSLEYLPQLGNYLSTGKVDEYDLLSSEYTKYRTQTRQKVGEMIKEYGGGDAGVFLYDVAMGMGDFLFTAAVANAAGAGLTAGANLPKAAEAFTLGIMGTQAANASTIEAKERGLDDNQAFIIGAISGMAEILTEKVSIEAFFKPSKALATKNKIKYIMQNALAEGSEEIGSDLINLFADIVIAGDKGEWKQRVQAYVDQGYSYDDAVGLAFVDQTKQTGLSFLAGFTSGTAMAGMGTFQYSNAANKTVNNMGLREGVQGLIDSGLSTNEESDSYQLANRLQGKVNNNQNVSNEELFGLWNANREAYQGEIEDLTSDLSKPAQATIKALYGENMDSKDYVIAMRQYYLAGAKNEDINDVKTNVELTDIQKQEMYNLGKEEFNETGRNLRKGSERANGSDSNVILSEVEENSGQNKEGYSETADRDISEVKFGEAIPTAEIIPGGSETIKVKPVVSGETQSMKVAREELESRGLNVHFVSGLMGMEGKIAGSKEAKTSLVRGAIIGNDVYVQVDHADFTAEQIAKHEATHADIREGKIDKDDVYSRIAGRDYDKLARDYRSAYFGSDMTDDQVLEEIICDSVAGINIFKAISTQLNKEYSPYFESISENVEKSTNQENAPPNKYLDQEAKIKELEQTEQVENAKSESEVKMSEEPTINIDGTDYVISSNGETAVSKSGERLDIVSVTDIDVGNKKKLKLAKNMARDAVLELREHMPVKISSDDRTLYFRRRSGKEFARSASARNLSKEKVEAKFASTDKLIDIIKRATNPHWAPDEDGEHGFIAERGWTYYDINYLAKFGDEYSYVTGQMNVSMSGDMRDYFDDIVEIKIETVPTAFTLHGEQSLSENSITQTENNNNTSDKNSQDNFERHSAEPTKDSEGRSLTKEQREFFKDSKARDEDGNLLVLYHGSRYAGFTVFNTDLADDGRSIFLTTNPKIAKSYSGTSEIYDPSKEWSYKELETYVSAATGGDWEVEKSGNKIAITELGYVGVEDVTHTFKSVKEAQDFFVDNYLNKVDLTSSESAANYQVYANATNPLIVDAENSYWNELPPLEPYARHIFDVEIEESKDDITISYEDEDGNRKTDSLKNYAHEDEFYKAYGITIDEQTKVFENDYVYIDDIYLTEDGKRVEEYGKTRDYAEYAQKNGYDSVIFKNVIDSGLYAGGEDRFTSSTVVVAFNSNQVKSISNENPTSNPDIRFSREAERMLDDVSSKEGDIRKFSMETFEKGGREYLAEYLAKYSGLSKADQKDILNALDWGYAIAEEMAGNKEYEAFGKWSKTGLVKSFDGTPLLEIMGLSGAPLRSVIVTNGEYPLNIDFTTICKKRMALDSILNRLVSDADIELGELSEEDFAGINRLIKEHGFEIACGLCYVDAKRYKASKYANTFVHGDDKADGHTYGWNELVTSMLKRGANVSYFELSANHVRPVGTLLSELDDKDIDFSLIDKLIKPYLKKDGTLKKAPEDVKRAYLLKTDPSSRHLLDANDIISSNVDGLKILNPELWKLVATHGAQAAPKPSMGFTAYGNDILRSNSFKKEDAYKVGGVRVQSFSDYVANMFFDYMQMFADMSARELPSHAYTKEPNYVKLFGMTGQRINMSLIFKGANLTAEQSKRLEKLLKKGRKYVLEDPEFGKLVEHAGLDENGNYIYEDESFPPEEAYKLRKDPRYKNCGTIAVGLSDAHIRKLLADPQIDMVIPYHASGVSQFIKNERNLALYTDYTGSQNTRDGNGKKLKKEFDWYANLKNGIKGGLDAKANADAYLEWCDKNGYTPKFPQFRDDANYYKLLEDFRSYDNNGKFMPQNKVTMTFPENFRDIVNDSLKEHQESYYGKLDAELSDDQNSLYTEVKNFLKEKSVAKFSQEPTTNTDLAKENREIKKDLAQSYKEIQKWKDEIKITESLKVRNEDVRKIAKQFKDIYSSTMTKAEIESKFKAFGDYVLNASNDKSMSAEEYAQNVKAMAVDLASDLVNSSEEMIVNYPEHEDIKNRLMRGVTISAEDKANIPDFESFRKANFGNIRIKNSGTSVDTMYEELNNLYPDLFPEEIKDSADRLLRMVKVVEETKPTYGNPFEQYSYDMASIVENVANDIVENAAYGQLRATRQSFADKQAAKIKSLESRVSELEEENATLNKNVNQRVRDKEVQAKNLEKAKDSRDQYREDRNKYRSQANARERQIAKIKERNEIREQRAKDKYNAMVQALKEKKNEDLLSLKEHYKEKERRSKEKRDASALRKKIEKHCKDLSAKLLKPTAKKHITETWEYRNDSENFESLKSVTAKVLSLINLESSYARNEEGKKAKDWEANIPTKKTQAMQELKDIYELIEQDGDYLTNEAMTGTNGWIKQIIGFADKPISTLNTRQLETILNCIKSLEQTISYANKMLTTEQSPSEVAFEFKEETDKKKPAKAFGVSILNNFSISLLNPNSFFERLGKIGEMLWEKLRAAQNQKILYEKDFVEWSQKNLKDYPQEWRKEHHTITLNGKNYKVTTPQLMELYALSQRPQGLNHILGDGIILDILDKKNPIQKIRRMVAGDNEIYNVSYEDLNKAFTQLSEEQLRVAKMMQEYSSNDLAKIQNEAAMIVYGCEIFNEDYYWMIRVDGNSLKTETAKGKSDNMPVSVGSAGFAQQINNNAKNPIHVGDAFTTFMQNVVNAHNYAAYLAVQEDMKRLYNYKYYVDGQYQGSFKNVLNKVFGGGEHGSRYWLKLMADVANGVGQEKLLTGNWIGKFKATAVSANLSVIAQQATALQRASDMISEKYLTIGAKHPLKGSEEAKEHSPIAWWKSQGYFDINTGRSLESLAYGSPSKLAKVEDALMRPAGFMDDFAWGILWNAVKAEMKDTNPDLEVGSEEYFKAVTKRFEDIIDRTQVVDGILQRSDIMRNKTMSALGLTSFAGEPLKQYNQFINALYNWKYGNGSGKTFIRSGIALMTAAILNASVRSLVGALRHSDRDKEFLDQWAEEMIGLTGEEKDALDVVKHVWGGNLVDSNDIFFSLPLLRDFKSAIEGYTIERADMSVVADIIKSADTMIKALRGDGKLTIGYAITNFAAELAKVTGLPASNIKRDVLSFTDTFFNRTDVTPWTYEYYKFFYKVEHKDNRARYMELLYDAQKKGDMATFDYIYNDLVAHGLKKDGIRTSLNNLEKKKEGVTKAAEVTDKAFVNSNQKTAYEEKVNTITNSKVYSQASAEQQQAIKNTLYTHVRGTNSTLEKSIQTANNKGLSDTDYLLYNLACQIVDKNQGNGNGSYDDDEKRKAAEMVGISFSAIKGK